jgi:CSLREA domain-containing protein
VRQAVNSTDPAARQALATFRALLVGLTALASAISYGATLSVTNLDDSGPGSLRERIAAANSGDTILFSVTGTISLTTGELFISKNLIIDGPGATSLIVERIAVGAPVSRVFNVDSGTVTISDIAIRQGFYGGTGAGINNLGKLTLNRCTVTNNRSRAADGGGIFNGDTLTLNDCTLTNNRAATDTNSGSGGGIQNEGTLTLNNCSLNTNQAPNGGGGISNKGTLNVNGCTFFNNLAQAGAGIENRANATITYSTFSSNIATTSSGGAISSSRVNGGTTQLVVDGCVFKNNEADGLAPSGGAIATGANSASSTATISNSLFQSNSADSQGGAISNFSNTTFGGNSTATVSVTNCTFSQNTAGIGGAVRNSTNGAGVANVTLRSCTLSRNGNSSGNGSGIANNMAGSNTATVTLANTILQRASGASSVNLANTGGAIVSQGYNLADDDGAGLLTGPGDQSNLDPKLDPAGLQNNGGPTPTVALIAGSPAIDRGNSFGTNIDQRGMPRPVDNPAVANLTDGSDIGAYESPADPIQDGSGGFFVTTLDDHDDGVCGVTDCTLREAIARCNVVPGPNTIGFSPALTGTITLKPAAGGQLVITEGVTILGPGARFLKISAFTQTRVFFVSGSGATTLTGLTIADGRLDNFNAGDSDGGGIYNQSTLTLVDCTVDFNRAVGGSAFMAGQNGGSGRGGGIFNAGALTLTRCTLKNNGATGGFGASNPPPPLTLTTGGTGGDARGAGVYNDAAASLVISNCTFAGNSASAAGGGSGSFGGNGGNGLGGAIFNLGTLDVSGSTFSGNTGDGGPGGAGTSSFNNGAPGSGTGGIVRGAGSAVLRNSIVAGNNTNSVFRDVSGALTSGGFNVIGRSDGSSGFGAGGDQAGTNAAPLDAVLSALANNGGPTDTMAPQPGSPALDQGKAFGLTSDQRGVARPVDIAGFPNASGGDGSDVGALELTPILVTTVDDHDDGSIVGDCTLREAINAANAQSGDDTIAFAAGVTGTIQLGSALPQISTSMVIAGPGANVVTVRRNTAPAYRIFVIANPPQNDPVVTISGLTIANGLAPNGGTPIDSGGGIINDRSKLTVRDCVLTGNSSSAASFSYGGGIMNSEGNLTVDRCTFSNNNAYYGGGIANRRNSVAGISTVTISNSTFVANTAAYGNALMNEVQNSGRIGNVSVTHCTFSGNVGSGNAGAGIYNSGANSGTVNLAVSHCTFTGNAADLGSSLYNFAFSGTATATLRNSIFATNGGANLFNAGGSMSSLGYNVSSDIGGGALTATGDKTNTDPLLAPLASNGGPTQTHALLPGSPALDNGRSFLLPFDQRGFARAADSPKFVNAAGGDGTDSGAFEVSPFGGIIDSDGDGMPNEFEVFFNVSDPNADADGDGDSNVKEYENRTEPSNNGSYLLRIISIVRNGSDVLITFNAVAGKTYRLEQKTLITDADWLSIPGVPDLTSAATGNSQFTNAGALAVPNSFYRVRLLP